MPGRSMWGLWWSSCILFSEDLGFPCQYYSAHDPYSYFIYRPLMTYELRNIQRCWMNIAHFSQQCKAFANIRSWVKVSKLHQCFVNSASWIISVIRPTGCTIYFKFIWRLTSTCFEQVYCSSSGGTSLYIHQLVCVMRLCWLVAAVSQQTHDIYRLLYEYIQSNTSWWWAVNLLETCRG